MKNDHDRDEFYTNISRLAKIIRTGRPEPQITDKYQHGFGGLKHWRCAVTASVADESHPKGLEATID